VESKYRGGECVMAPFSMRRVVEIEALTMIRETALIDQIAKVNDSVPRDTKKRRAKVLAWLDRRIKALTASDREGEHEGGKSASEAEND